MNNGQTGNSGIRFHIAGGAGPYQAAAVAAVVEHTLAEERRVASPPPRRFSNWMMVARSEPFVPPRTISNGSLNGALPWSVPRVNRPARL